MPDALKKALVHVLLPLSVGAFIGGSYSSEPMLALMTLFPLGIIACVVWAIALVVMTVKAAWRARWRKCLGLLAILLVVLPMSCEIAIRGGDYVRLAVMWPSYWSKIQAQPGQRVTFDWGLTGLVPGAVQRTLVYDPSDSEANEKDVPFDSYYGTFTRHRHLIGHYYLVENNA